MKPMHLLNAAIALSAGIGFALPTQAGIPVIDGGNLTQNIMTATESVSQTLKQIEQYQTQLEQYENQLQNTLAPASYIWDQAQDTINKLSQSTDTLAYYKQQLGSLDDYLGQFQDLDYYKNSPCFTSAGCSDADRAALEKTQELASESQKKANDAVFRGLDEQQRNLKRDASTLQDLQRNAQGAKGQMEAISYANQLASQQANQLLQIRSLLMTQQNAIATQQQAQADKESMQQAASERFWTISSPDRSKDQGFKP